MSEMIIFWLLKIIYFCIFVTGIVIILLALFTGISIFTLYLKYPEDPEYRLRVQRDIKWYLESKRSKEGMKNGNRTNRFNENEA